MPAGGASPPGALCRRPRRAPSDARPDVGAGRSSVECCEPSANRRGDRRNGASWRLEPPIPRQRSQPRPRVARCSGHRTRHRFPPPSCRPPTIDRHAPQPDPTAPVVRRAAPRCPAVATRCRRGVARRSRLRHRAAPLRDRLSERRGARRLVPCRGDAIVGREGSRDGARIRQPRRRRARRHRAGCDGDDDHLAQRAVSLEPILRRSHGSVPTFPIRRK